MRIIHNDCGLLRPAIYHLKRCPIKISDDLVYFHTSLLYNKRMQRAPGLSNAFCTGSLIYSNFGLSAYPRIPSAARDGRETETDETPPSSYRPTSVRLIPKGNVLYRTESQRPTDVYDRVGGCRKYREYIIGIIYKINSFFFFFFFMFNIFSLGFHRRRPFRRHPPPGTKRIANPSGQTTAAAAAVAATCCHDTRQCVCQRLTSFTG